MRLLSQVEERNEMEDKGTTMTVLMAPYTSLHNQPSKKHAETKRLYRPVTGIHV